MSEIVALDRLHFGEVFYSLINNQTMNDNDGLSEQPSKLRTAGTCAKTLLFLFRVDIKYIL